MVLSYTLSSLMMWRFGKQGFLLVVGASNLDENLRGDTFKYDCSSADINPLGSIPKNDLRDMVQWISEHNGYPSLKAVLAAAGASELAPFTDIRRTTEEEMGMTFEELHDFGTLRKEKKCGPVSMFRILIDKWSHLEFVDVAAKVKYFFVHYSQNRHKAAISTPSYFIDNYCVEDNRFDMRQLFYDTKWEWQFLQIDKEVAALESTGKFVENSQDWN
jgi:NAD+ synthase (glutamine-hydrolysing)